MFKTSYGRLEIVRRADGIGDYAAWLRNSQQRDVLPQMRRDFRDSGAL